MTRLLLLLLPFICLAQNGNNQNDPNKKLFQLPFLSQDHSNLAWGGALGAGATLLGQELLGGNNNNCGGGFGRRRRQADGTNNKIFGLLGGGNNCNNPCGRKRRAAIDTGEKVDTKFFGLFGGGNNNCGNNGGYNQGGYNQGGYNQGGYNQGGYNQGGYNSICQCTNLSKTDNYGREEARCQK